jgi:putative glutamine amidotransferase
MTDERFRPLIGVTTSEMREARLVNRRSEGEPVAHEMALGLTYLRAIESAGGIPLVLAPLELAFVAPLLERVDGICLSGGPDVDPDSYGEGRRSSHLGPTEPDLDLFELAVAAAASERGMPVLAICRGMQVLNVSRGGSLHQHLPDLGLSVDHRQRKPGRVPTHDVTLAPESRLAKALGEELLVTNSFHHQAIDRLGSGLVPVAWADDRTIEGTEDPEKPFMLAVQWHAELHRDRGPEQALFEAFVAAAGDALLRTAEHRRRRELATR